MIGLPISSPGLHPTQTSSHGRPSPPACIFSNALSNLSQTANCQRTLVKPPSSSHQHVTRQACSLLLSESPTFACNRLHPALFSARSLSLLLIRFSRSHAWISLMQGACSCSRLTTAMQYIFFNKAFPRLDGFGLQGHVLRSLAVVLLLLHLSLFLLWFRSSEPDVYTPIGCSILARLIFY